MFPTFIAERTHNDKLAKIVPLVSHWNSRHLGLDRGQKDVIDPGK